MCHGCVRELLLRPASWLARTWKRSAKGNEFINAEGFNVVDAAETWLRCYLADGGKSKFVWEEGKKAGHSDPAISQAERNLEVWHRSDGTGFCRSPGIGEGTPEEIARLPKPRQDRRRMWA